MAASYCSGLPGTTTRKPSRSTVRALSGEWTSTKGALGLRRRSMGLSRTSVQDRPTPAPRSGNVVNLTDRLNVINFAGLCSGTALRRRAVLVSACSSIFAATRIKRPITIQEFR